MNLRSEQETRSTTTKEEWRRFRDTKYLVSNAGRVFSEKSGRMLSNKPTPTGYVRKHFRGLGTFFVHRLVAECFLDPDPDRPWVNHIDGVKDNNHVWNLEWCTPKENSIHAAETGLSPSGEKHSNSALTEHQVAEARALHASGEYTHTDLATLYGVNRSTVARAVKGSTYLEVDEPTSADDEAARRAKSEARIKQLESSREEREAVRKKREAYRKRKPSEKLTVQQVLTIRDMAVTMRPQEISDELGLGLYSVMRIVSRKTYAWVVDSTSKPPKPGPKPR